MWVRLKTGRVLGFLALDVGVGLEETCASSSPGQSKAGGRWQEEEEGEESSTKARPLTRMANSGENQPLGKTAVIRA